MGRFDRWLIVAALPAFTALAAGAQDDIGNSGGGLASGAGRCATTMKRRAATAVDTECGCP